MKKFICLLFLFTFSTLRSQEIIVEDRFFHVIEEGLGSADINFENFTQTNEGEIIFTAEIALLRRVLENNDDINVFLPQVDLIFNFDFRDLAFHKESGDIWVLVESQISFIDWWLYRISPDNTITTYSEIIPVGESASEMVVDSAGIVWVGVSAGLLSFNPQTNEKTFYDFSEFALVSPPTFMKIMPDQSIWFYVANRIISFDGSEFSLKYDYFEDGQFISNFDVNENGECAAIVRDGIFSYESFLVHFTPESPDGEIIEILCLPENAKPWDVQFGQHGELWVSCRRSVQLPTETQWGTTQAVYYNGEWICSETTDWLEESYEVEPVIYPHYQEGVYMPIKNYADVENHPVISRHIWLDGISGVEQPETDGFSMQVFPNPADGAFSVMYSLDETVEVALKVFDCTGRQLFQKALGIRPAGNHTTVVDLKQMPEGLYFVEVVSQERRQSRRLVINH